MTESILNQITITLDEYNELLTKSIYQEEYENILKILCEKDDEINYLKTKIKNQ